MKLHSSVIEKLISLFEMHGGHRNESKLRSSLGELQLSEYKRQTGEKILVVSEDLDTARDEVVK